MNEPQWVGAVQSYAGKYALQALFAIGEEDVDHFEVAEESLRPNQSHQNQQPQAQPQQQNTPQPNFISNEQHDLIMQQLNELALLSGKDFEYIGNYYLQKYKLKNFHELLVPGLEIVVNDLQGEINKRRGN